MVASINTMDGQEQMRKDLNAAAKLARQAAVADARAAAAGGIGKDIHARHARERQELALRLSCMVREMRRAKAALAAPSATATARV